MAQGSYIHRHGPASSERTFKLQGVLVAGNLHYRWPSTLVFPSLRNLSFGTLVLETPKF